MKIGKLFWGAAAVAALGGLSYVNYRRFMPAAKPLGDASYDITVEKKIIRADGKEIYGELLLPKNVQGPLPTVIVCHGFGSNYRAVKAAIGKAFALSGYAVYCFDFCGGSRRTKSSGRFHDMTIFSERADLLFVIDAVKTWPTTDKNRLYLLGESQGGMVAGITAPLRKDDIRAMVLYYPAFCIPFDSRAKFASKEEIPDETEAFRLKIGGEYYRSTYDFDVYGTIKDYDGPVLIMHGDKDDVVPLEYGRRGAEVYPNAAFEVFPGEIHGWYGKGKRKAAEHAFSFFEKHA